MASRILNYFFLKKYKFKQEFKKGLKEKYKNRINWGSPKIKCIAVLLTLVIRTNTQSQRKVCKHCCDIYQIEKGVMALFKVITIKTGKMI